MSKASDVRVQLEPSGFVLLSGASRKAMVAWSNVAQITAYKADLLTYDTVAIRFDLLHPPTSVTVDEECVGFESLLPHLSCAFPNLDSGWYERIVQPPFAANETILFKRNAGDT